MKNNKFTIFSMATVLVSGIGCSVNAMEKAASSDDVSIEFQRRSYLVTPTKAEEIRGRIAACPNTDLVERKVEAKYSEAAERIPPAYVERMKNPYRAILTAEKSTERNRIEALLETAAMENKTNKAMTERTSQRLSEVEAIESNMRKLAEQLHQVQQETQEKGNIVAAKEEEIKKMQESLDGAASGTEELCALLEESQIMIEALRLEHAASAKKQIKLQEKMSVLQISTAGLEHFPRIFNQLHITRPVIQKNDEKESGDDAVLRTSDGEDSEEELMEYISIGGGGAAGRK